MITMNIKKIITGITLAAIAMNLMCPLVFAKTYTDVPAISYNQSTILT